MWSASNDAVRDLEFALLDPRKGAVDRERGDLEINRAVGGAVGVPLSHEHLDHVDLLLDVAGGRRLDVGRQAVEGGAVGVEDIRPLPGDLGERPLLAAAPGRWCGRRRR